MKRRTRQSCEARGVSLPVEISKQVDERLKDLRPRVKGFSHYIQLLVDWDLKKGSGEPKPFNHAVTALAA